MTSLPITFVYAERHADAGRRGPELERYSRFLAELRQHSAQPVNVLRGELEDALAWTASLFSRHRSARASALLLLPGAAGAASRPRRACRC